MRTRNEMILVGVVIAIIVLIANFFGYQWLAKKQKDLDLTYTQLVEDKKEAELTLQNDAETKAAQERGWIKDHEPPLGEAGLTQSQVVEELQKGARDNKLEIVSQSLSGVQTGSAESAGTRINVTITVKGSMQSLVHWLTDLEKPANFYAVSSFSLKVDAADEKAFVCKVELGRYFKTGS